MLHGGHGGGTVSATQLEEAFLGEMVCKLMLKEKWNFRRGGGTGIPGEGQVLGQCLPHSSFLFLDFSFFSLTMVMGTESLNS